jgi:hypothetical protein
MFEMAKNIIRLEFLQRPCEAGRRQYPVSVSSNFPAFQRTARTSPNKRRQLTKKHLNFLHQAVVE